jgi:hypothetical protein
MRFDLQSVRDAQRQAFNTLANPSIEVHGQKHKNPYHVAPSNISIGAQLIQEQPFVNSLQTFTFIFDSNAPQPSSTLGNVVLGKTNVMCIYGIQLLIGEGTNANNRIYRSRGNTPNDDSIYNSNLILTVEQSNVIDKMNCINFRDVGTNANEFWAEAGLYLINPQRLINGELGKFQITITMYNSISGLTLTPNLFLSLRLHGAFGQPSGVAHRR